MSDTDIKISKEMSKEISKEDWEILPCEQDETKGSGKWVWMTDEGITRSESDEQS